jgi:uncharacterized protein (DUF1501 family)
MYLIGNAVKGGHYGDLPSLTELNDGNMQYTTDFRQVYATAISGWLGLEAHEQVLRYRFKDFPVFS